MTRILVLCYSSYGHVRTLAKAVAEGASPDPELPSTSGEPLTRCPRTFAEARGSSMTPQAPASLAPMLPTSRQGGLPAQPTLWPRKARKEYPMPRSLIRTWRTRIKQDEMAKLASCLGPHIARDIGIGGAEMRRFPSTRWPF